MPVRTIASLIEMGETQEVLREDYPHVRRMRTQSRCCGPHANPRRGRPVRSWDAAASRPVPKRRAARSA